MEAVIVQLNTPVIMGDVEVRALTFKRKATVKDMRDIPLGSMSFSHVAKMIGRLSGVSEEAVLRMELDDFHRVFEAAGPFFGDFLKTGE